MPFVVAGAALVAAFAVGILSLAYVCYRRCNESSDDNKINYRAALASTSASFFRFRNPKRFAVVTLSAVICAGASFVTAYCGYGTAETVKLSLTAIVMTAVMVIDYKEHIIPNFLVLIQSVIGAAVFAAEMIVQHDGVPRAVIIRIGGVLFCVAIFYILSRLTKNGIGMGDVKFISALCLTVGIINTFLAVLFSLIICSAISTVLLISKKKNKTDQLPFGPFMFFGYILFMLLHCI